MCNYNDYIDKKSKYVTREYWLKKNDILLYNKIIKNTQNYVVPFKEKVYLFRHKTTPPKCKICNETPKFLNFNLGYRKYCSTKCAANDEKIKKNKKISNIQKYGVEYPQQSKEIKNKIKKTNIEKYGVENPFQSEQIKEKIKQTIMKKYGVENLNKLIIYRKKIEQTNIKKYGVKTFLLTKELKNININCYNIVYINKWSKILNIDKSNIILDNNKVKLKGYCKKHKIFEISKDILYSRWHTNKIKFLCTKCFPVKRGTSFLEKEIKEYIKTLNIVFEENNRKILNNEIDIYIPDHKLAIEFDGLYWHSELFKDKNYHLNKTEKCEKQGIELIHIFEDEWLYKKEIVKNIIKSKLGLINNKINASDCEIKEINDNKLIRNFLENNHINGYIGSEFKIGLFYNNELISLMILNKKYEILRFCDRNDIIVIDSMSKLLKYFINYYKPNLIIMFVDRRYDSGKRYEVLGFTYKEKTRPNYWYTTCSGKIIKRNHRFKYKKNILIKQGYNSNKTEHEIMLENNYLRVYDCGKTKYEYILKY